MLDTEIIKQTPSMTSLKMAASSGSAGLVSVSSEQRQLDAVQQLQEDVTRYARANDRRMILRSINKVRPWLSNIPLATMQPSSAPLEDLEAEALGEVIILNGISFKPHGISAYGKMRSNANSLSNRNALVMLRGLCNELCRTHPTLTTSPESLYAQLIWRISKTTASSDAHDRLRSIMANGDDLLVQPISSSTAQAAAAAVAAIRQPTSASTPAVSQSRGSAAGPAASSDYSPNRDSNVLTPIDINVYVDKESNSVHMTSSVTFSFGLFRKTDISPNRPWIAVSAGVRERTNLSNRSSVRFMSLKVPDLY